ncbi:MAG TPA: hypothetical protein VIV15_16165, partial [Anaerolineales bacterium]
RWLPEIGWVWKRAKLIAKEDDPPRVARLAVQGLTAVLRLWDNASWHIRHEGHPWLRQQNRRVTQTGQGVRLGACRLPRKSPWLNPMEPKWVHGKRAIVAPARLLRAQEISERV